MNIIKNSRHLPILDELCAENRCSFIIHRTCRFAYICLGPRRRRVDTAAILHYTPPPTITTRDYYFTRVTRHFVPNLTLELNKTLPPYCTCVLSRVSANNSWTLPFETLNHNLRWVRYIIKNVLWLLIMISAWNTTEFN